MRRRAHRGRSICTLLHADVACEGWLLSDRTSQASRRLDGWMEGELKLLLGKVMRECYKCTKVVPGTSNNSN